MSQKDSAPEKNSGATFPDVAPGSIAASNMENTNDEERCNPEETATPSPQEADAESTEMPSEEAVTTGSAPEDRKKRHPLLVLLLFVLTICFGAGLYGWNEVQSFLGTAPETPGRSVIIDIDPGMTLAQVSARLEKEGVITNDSRFQLLARWENKGRNLQAGRFLLNTGWMPEQVLEMLTSGRSMLYKVTLREGLPWWGVAEILEKEGFCKAEDFATVIHSKDFLQHWSIPFDSAEGFLFPETYLLPHPRELNMEAARAVADRLVEMFWKQADKLWIEGRPAQSDLKRLVTLASIVEKETSVPSERARVAGVYNNRLRRNMLLQADPTVIYGMGPEFKGRLLYKHLDDKKNVYNSYQHPGLPPGPICSFGAAALQAALSPEDHSFLYFVATGKGREHTFSKTLSEHNRAVREYRAVMRNKKKPESQP